MQITMENIKFESTSINNPTWSDQIELINLISADITISAGEKSILYDEASVIDFSIQMASAFMVFLTSGVDRIKFRSPDYHDIITIKMDSEDPTLCNIVLNNQTISQRELFIEVVYSLRSFLHEVRSLIESQYGHIERIWEFLVVSVF